MAATGRYLKNFAKQSAFAKMLNLEYPLVLGPMSGVSSIELTAAVSNYGGLGSHGVNYVSPEEIKEIIQSLKATVSPKKPFAINIWVPIESQEKEAIRALESGGASAFELQRNALSSAYKQFNIQPPEYPIRKQYSDPLVGQDYSKQIEMILNCEPPVVSFIMGIPDPDTIAEAKRRKIHIIGTATTVQEAVAYERAGFDAVVASGSEGGGHRGSFLAPVEESLVGTIALVPTMKDIVKIPVIASGGISDSRGIIASIALGADAVQLGTAFVLANESAAPEAYKRALADRERSATTVLTRAWSGRYARGQPNNFTKQASEEVPNYPVQNYLTQPLRKAAGAHGNHDYLSIWSGQAAPLGKRGSAKQILDELVQGCDTVLSKLQSDSLE